MVTAAVFICENNVIYIYIYMHMHYFFTVILQKNEIYYTEKWKAKLFNHVEIRMLSSWYKLPYEFNITVLV